MGEEEVGKPVVLFDSPFLLELLGVDLESSGFLKGVTFQVVWNLIISQSPCHLNNSSDLTGCVPASIGSDPKSFAYFNLCTDCKSDDHYCTSLQPATFFPITFS